MSRSRDGRSWPRSLGAARQRRVARGAIEGDARLDAVENEGVAFGLCDADVCSGIEFETDGGTVTEFAVADGAGAPTALLSLARRVVYDEPECIIGKKSGRGSGRERVCQ